MTEHNYKPLFRIRAIAVTETLIAIGVLLVINLFFFNGDRFAGVTPHPFWFVVILISAQYGVAEGVFAAVVATLAFLIGNVRPRNVGEYLYSYLTDIGSQPFLWLLTAVILGSLRFRHVVERDKLRADLAAAIERGETIALHYEQLRGVKEMLEQRLVRQVQTAVDAYKAGRLMESRGPAKILEGVQELVRSILMPRQFSLFLLKGDALEASITSAWTQSDNYLKLIPSSHPLFEQVIVQKRSLCIVNEGDEPALANQGMLAGPVMAENGQILGMLKIEAIDFTELHISTIEAFRIVCSWIGNAYVQAQDYQTVSSRSLISPENDLYSYEFFKLQAEYATFLARRFNLDLALIAVKLLGAAGMTPDKHTAAVRLMGKAVEKNLRKIDQVFNYQPEENTYYILLPGTSQANSKIVIDKLNRVFERARQETGTDLQLSFAVQSLSTRSAT